ncbi:LOB domain-containing protein 4 [Neltuma alba]|uniref:LOB domain-containing protein 4 n=1 Tax=Neltuma alba TaxID=207710 RepID=UPI0010A36E89|nr:LOB domain-containing protein 4 [Prosopis alba]
MREGGRSKQGTMSPCAACKLLRRRCAQDCVFAPYFPADEPQKFASVHKVFGASNVNKMLQELPEHQRSDAVSSMVYEANARVRDPVYGCVGAISSLQHQVDVLQTQLALAQAEVVHMRSLSQFSSSSSPPQTTTVTLPSTSSPDHHHHHHSNNFSNNIMSPSPSSRLSARSFFAMDVAESLWSC